MKPAAACMLAAVPAVNIDEVVQVSSRNAELVIATITMVACLLILSAMDNRSELRELSKRKKLLLLLDLAAKQDASPFVKDQTFFKTASNVSRRTFESE